MPNINLNVALKRQVHVLPKLYNCGSFISFIGNMRLHIRKSLLYAYNLSSKMFKGAAIKFFQHTHLPLAKLFMQLSG
jgi:hypothetical protein